MLNRRNESKDKKTELENGSDQKKKKKNQGGCYGAFTKQMNLSGDGRKNSPLFSTIYYFAGCQKGFFFQVPL